jgi:type I restriction enzyme, R subunit
MSEKLEAILQRFKDDWDALEQELRKFIDELRRGDRNDFPILTRMCRFHSCASCWKNVARTENSPTTRVTKCFQPRLIWSNGFAREYARSDSGRMTQGEILTKALVRDLDGARICLPGTEGDLAQTCRVSARES